MEFSGQNTGVGSLSLLQGIFLTQELNQGLLHCRRIPHQLSYQGYLDLKWELLFNCPGLWPKQLVKDIYVIHVMDKEDVVHIHTMGY